MRYLIRILLPVVLSLVGTLISVILALFSTFLLPHNHLTSGVVHLFVVPEASSYFGGEANELSSHCFRFVHRYAEHWPVAMNPRILHGADQCPQQFVISFHQEQRVLR